MVETCYIPQALDEALRIRKETGAKPLAGGTDLMVMHRRGTGIVPSFPWPVMIISSLEELKYIRKEENEIVIGSGTTCHAIEDDESIPYAVRKAASLMGAESLRNLATIGGNICNASPKADLPVPLIMMDAKVTLVSATSSRTLLLDEFITGPKETDLREDELLLEVRIPLPAKPYSHVWYRKIGTRKANAISKLSVSAALTVSENGVIEDFRSANGASGPKVARNAEVEKRLIGKMVEDLPSILEEFLDAYDSILSPHAMPAYRRLSTRRMLSHFLTEVARGSKETVIS